MKKILGLILAVGLMLGALPARAEYPDKAITCIVPFAPGGAADITVRMVADYLSTELGQPLVIVNKGGGSGIPGLNSGLKARPDGYTVLGGSIGNAFVATYFLGAPAYDMDKIAFVGAYMPHDRLLLTRPDKPYKTWQELVEYARTHPGEVAIGHGASQEGLEVVKAAGIKEGVSFNQVMYKSGGPATADLLGDHIDVCDLGTGTAGFQAARKGDLIIIANLGTAEVPFFPDVPKLRDMGAPFATSLMYGFAFPNGTPEAIRLKWEQALAKVMQNKELLDKMHAAGFTPAFLNGKEYREFSRNSTIAVQEMLKYNKQGSKK